MPALILWTYHLEPSDARLSLGVTLSWHHLRPRRGRKCEKPPPLSFIEIQLIHGKYFKRLSLSNNINYSHTFLWQILVFWNESLFSLMEKHWLVWFFHCILCVIFIVLLASSLSLETFHPLSLYVFFLFTSISLSINTLLLN